MPTTMPPINFLAVLVSALFIWILGALWYSKALFAPAWMKLQGIPETPITPEQKKMMPIMLLQAFIAGCLTSLVMAALLNHFVNPTPLRGALIGLLMWIGFAGATSYASYLFSMKPKMLWLIDSGYNLVCFVGAGCILAVWR